MKKILLTTILLAGIGPIAQSWGSPNRPVEQSEATMKPAVSVLHDTHIPGAKKGSCTGTLISSDVVLTAAHCVVKILEISPKIKLS